MFAGTLAPDLLAFLLMERGQQALGGHLTPNAAYPRAEPVAPEPSRTKDGDQGHSL